MNSHAATGRTPPGSAATLPRVASQDQALYWTDDLPVCQSSGIGSSTNQYYRQDGQRQQHWECEDRSFHFRIENDVYLYGLFDGHDGYKVSNFAAQRMPAELLLGQLSGKVDDNDIKYTLQQAFINVEKAFFDSIDDLMAEKARIRLSLPEGMNQFEIFSQYPDQTKQLEAIESDLTGGTTAVVALIINNRLYVANVGCSRALLCKLDEDRVLRVAQLTVDHDLKNAEELSRLVNLGLNVDVDCKLSGKLGHNEYTRTIGDCDLKFYYKDLEQLSTATSEPVIPMPEVHGGIELDDSCSFLILMSDGLYNSLQDATGDEHANRQIASMVAAEFAVQSTLNGVSQAVVDRVVRMHHDAYMTSSDRRRELCQVRDDITLLVRQFNYPLPNAMSSPMPTPPTMGPNLTSPLSVIIPAPGTATSTRSTSPQQRPFFPPPAYPTQSTVQPAFNTISQSTKSSTYTSSNESTQSGDDSIQPFRRSINAACSLKLDKEGRIEPYIDFSDFNKTLEAMSEAEREEFSSQMEVRASYPTIPEEKEIISPPTTPGSAEKKWPEQ